jgi:predicted nucleotidyltransferase component of viral defense system
MDKTLALSSNLEEKIRINNCLMIEIFEQFGEENFLFTGGTSLMSSDIIKRFSEDIDLITTVSRIKIRNWIKSNENIDIEDEKDNSGVTTFTIAHKNNDQITTKLDIVKFSEKYGGRYENLSDMSDQEITIKCTITGIKKNVKRKNINFIFYDKISAILESYYELKKLNTSNKSANLARRNFAKKSNEKYNLRRVRDYYDIVKLTDSIELDINECQKEFNFRKNQFKSKKSDYEYNYEYGIIQVEEVLKFLNNEEMFKKKYLELDEQLFRDEVLSIENDRLKLVQIFTNIKNQLK